jgi:hypothetical protein
VFNVVYVVEIGFTNYILSPTNDYYDQEYVHLNVWKIYIFHPSVSFQSSLPCFSALRILISTNCADCLMG